MDGPASGNQTAEAADNAEDARTQSHDVNSREGLATATTESETNQGSVDSTQPKDEDANVLSTAEDLEKQTKATSESLTTRSVQKLGLEKRLEQLKKSLKILEDAISSGDEIPGGFSDEEDDNTRQWAARKSIPKLNILTMSQYEKRHLANSFSLKEKHYTIDVITAAGWSPNPTDQGLSSSGEQKAQQPTEPLELPYSPTNSSEGIRFLQINSQALCAVLHKYAVHDNQSTLRVPTAPIIMLAPFKPLCYHWKELQSHLDRLRIKYANFDWEKLVAPNTINRENMVLETQEDKQENVLRYSASWRGVPGYLQISQSGGHLLWTQPRNGKESMDTCAFGIDRAVKVERTTATSPLSALKVEFTDYIEEWLFTHPDTAHKDLKTLSDVLARSIRRMKIERQHTDADKDPENMADPTSEIAGGDMMTRMMEVQHLHQKDDTESQIDGNDEQRQRRLERHLLGTVEWKTVDLAETTDAINYLGSDDSGSDCFKAFEDLQCLAKLYEQYVKPAWEHFHSTSLKNVRFSNLWSVFRPGQEVFVREDVHKVWRVYAVTGGRPTLDHLLSDNFTVGTDIIAETSESSKKTKTTNTDEESKASDSARQSESIKVPTSGNKTYSESRNWTKLDLDCYYIDFDGQKFVPVYRSFAIRFFSGLKDVKTLLVYPFSSLLSEESRVSKKLVEEIITNGERFKSMCLAGDESQNRLFYYDGRTNVNSPSGNPLPRDPRWRSGEDSMIPATRLVRAEDVTSQVVIDFDKTFQYNPDWRPPSAQPIIPEESVLERHSERRNSPTVYHVQELCVWEEDYDEQETNQWITNDEWMRPFSGDDLSNQGLLREKDYYLLPDRVFGFILRTRSWACLDIHVNRLRPVQTDSSWDDLQIVEDHKVTLKALVERHFASKDAAQRATRDLNEDFDLIQGKGRGLIILLHGAPGLGKTSTAESIAGKYKKPLLPMTCGNLGVDATSVEQALRENFELAQAWDCIVLLDEADVFLAEREHTSLERNALVSVFLRTLEYYSGILFLTTNRIGSFDEAFRSRIHSSLFYPDLSESQTREIWSKALDRLSIQNDQMVNKMAINDRETILNYAIKVWHVYIEYQQAPWNGRQIRNGFQTAVALAEYTAKHESSNKEPMLTWMIFKKVILASHNFEKYLLETREGMTDSDRAANKKLRKDQTIDVFDPNAKSLRAERRQRTTEFYKALEEVVPNTVNTGAMVFHNAAVSTAYGTPVTGAYPGYVQGQIMSGVQQYGNQPPGYPIYAPQMQPQLQGQMQNFQTHPGQLMPASSNNTGNFMQTPNGHMYGMNQMQNAQQQQPYFQQMIPQQGMQMPYQQPHSQTTSTIQTNIQQAQVQQQTEVAP